MTTRMPAAPTTRDTVVEKNIDLAFDFMRAQIDDPALIDEIPDGVTLVLLPLDDPDQLAANVEIGLAAIRRGEDVYFRHLPEAPAQQMRSGD